MDTGLEFRCVDLHIHTPASNCFIDKSVKAEQIVQEAIDKGLDAIAVTDHNTGDWIDKVKDAAQGTTLTVFPGIEISVAPKIHVVALFDTEKGTEHVNGVLSALGVKPEDRGRPEVLCRKSLDDISDIIHEWSGLMVLAHIDAVKGAFQELVGQDRIQVFNSNWYDAVECTGADLPPGLHSGNGYQRFPAHYQASDNPDAEDPKKHSITGIGTRSSQFRLHKAMNLEGLRQCFIDPEVRIRPMSWHCDDLFPHILDMKIVGGFLDGQAAIFNQGLNSIFGGKGAGKSLMVEFMRFALNQPPRDSAILDDHKKKIDKCLGLEGAVLLRFRTGTGTTYMLVRTGDGDVVCSEEATNTEYQGHVEELLPVLAYSQTEIIKISEDLSAQLALTDSFVDSGSYRRNILDIQSALEGNDRSYAEALAAKAELDGLTKDAETLKAKIAEIDAKLKGSEDRARLQHAFQAAKIKGQSLETLETYADTISKKITNIKKEIKIPAVQEVTPKDADLSWARGQGEQVYAEVQRILESAVAVLEKYKGEVSGRRSAWLPEFQDAENKYKETLASDEQRLNSDRDKFSGELAKLTAKIAAHRELASHCPTLGTSRSALLDQLDSAHHNFYLARKQVYDELTRQSSRKLELEIEHATDGTSFATQLKELLSGGNIRGDYIKEISRKLTPRRFVELMLSENPKMLAVEAEIPDSTAENICKRLMTAESLLPLLGLQHSFYRQDVPSIRYRKDDGTYAGLDEISVGQKCTALLIIALCHGERPIIIDQPEDALDIKTVWEDVSQKLRQSKTQRQFILTTHNNTVAVSSDTDMMIHVESNATCATIKCLGGIEYARQQAMQILEGGREPYRLRNAKYNLKA